MTIKKKLDELLQWYDDNGKVVTTVKVNCRPLTLRRFCVRVDGKEFYKGREIVAVKAKRPKKVEESQMSLRSCRYGVEA